MSYMKRLYEDIQCDVIDILRDYGIEDPNIDMVSEIINRVVEEVPGSN